MTTVCLPVGTKEMIDLLGVARATISQWRERGQFLEPRWTVSSVGAWNAADTIDWVEQWINDHSGSSFNVSRLDEQTEGARDRLAALSHLMVPCDTCDPVGVRDIAQRLDIPQPRVVQWRSRGRLLPERWQVGLGPAWNYPDVVAWHDEWLASRPNKVERLERELAEARARVGA